MRLLFHAGLAFILNINCMHAQTKHIMLQVEGGIGYAFMDKPYFQRLSTSGNRLNMAPHFGISAQAGLSRSLILETGMLYLRKGDMNYFDFTLDHGNGMVFRDQLHQDLRLEYLSIPVILNYRMNWSRNHSVAFGAGMHYGFLMNARSIRIATRSLNGEQIAKQKYVQDIPSALVGTRDRMKYGIVSTFEPSVKLQLEYRYRSRYYIKCFYDHSLYSFWLHPVKRMDHQLRLFGLSLGYSFLEL